MARPARGEKIQTAVRIPKAWLKDLDDVAKALSRPWFQASRSDAFRAALARGIEELKKEAETAG